jgi:hypothetical protein
LLSSAGVFSSKGFRKNADTQEVGLCKFKEGFIIHGGVAMSFEVQRDILLKELELVKRIASLQEEAREAVISRDWTDFEDHFKTLECYKSDLALLENERSSAFAQMTGATMGAAGTMSVTEENGAFYKFASSLSQEERIEITEIYRNLKIETLRVRVASESLMHFITSARSAITGFFQALFPQRTGKTYTPYGKPASSDMRSMVLNESR